MKILNKIAVMMCLLAVAACSKENPTTDNSLSGVVTIKVTSPAMGSTKAIVPGTEQENKIENLKIFVLVGASNPTIEKLYDFDPSQDHIFDADTRWNAAKQSMEMGEFANPDQMRAIYTVANWKPANIVDYQAGKPSEGLLQQITTNLSQSRSPFVMSGYQSAQFTTQSRYEIKLVRQPIKVEMILMLDVAFAATYPDFIFGKLDEQTTPTMGVLSTPNMSSVYNTVSINDETGFGYVNIAPKEVSQGEVAGVKSWAVSYYLYENPTEEKISTKATKFVFRLPYQKTGGNAQMDNYYAIALKTSDITAPYKTVRNTIYRVTATLLGFGSTTPTDFDNTVSTSVKVVSWDDEAYDDQIGGAKLGVNLSSINIRGGVINTRLVVASDDLGKVTFTDVSALLNGLTIDHTTGVVSVNTTTAIGLYTPNYATFKVKRGNLSKTITVHAGLWASGNITYNATSQQYVNSTDPQQNGLYFFYDGNVIKNVGLRYGQPDNTVWSVASKYYVSANGNITEKSGIADWNDNRFKVAGDPCALIAPKGEWRLPDQNDYNSLNQNKGARDVGKNGQYFYNNTMLLKWAGCAVKGGLNFYNTNGLYWAQGGRFESYSTVDQTGWSTSKLDYDNFTVRCVHK